MGVRGLTSYIDDIETLWTQIELQDTKLIIDGSGLCNYLYRSNGFECRHGGQYDEFYNVVLSFFDALDSKGVESFVILDGAKDSSGKKLDTDKKRAKRRIQTSHVLAENLTSADGDDFLLPLLSKLVFIQALRDRGIKFAVCDSEADAEIASLANAWNCPALSNDSDFFIYNIKAGYIPLSSLNWNSIRLTTKIFHRRKLATHLRIDEELLPLFASLAGNDYVSAEALEPFFQALRRIHTSMGKGHWRRKEERFAAIANVLSGGAMVPLTSVFREVSRYDKGQLEQAVEHSMQEYTKTKSNLLSYFQDGVVCSFLRTQNDDEIDELVLRRFREGQFSTNCMSSLTAGKVFLKAQVENCQEVSANCCSQLLRQYAYGILNDAAAHSGGGNITMVQEWHREGLTLKLSNVTPHQEGVVQSASAISSLQKDEKLLNVLDSNTDEIKSLPDNYKLIAASLRFLANNAKPKLKKNHLAALLCSCVKLEDGSWKQYLEDTESKMEQPFDLQAAQSFAQWQCALRDAIHLNFVFLEPVETPCIHKTFNGRLAHYLQSELDRGRKPEDLLPSPENRFLYKKLWNVLTNDREEEDEITARIQNLNLCASPGHSKNFTAGESRHSRSTLPSRGVSPPKELSRSTYSSPSNSFISGNMAAASYDPMGYRSERRRSPPNITTRRPSSGAWSMGEADEPPAHSFYGQRNMHHQSSEGEGQQNPYPLAILQNMHEER
ncbi:hypothetical protein ACROYT_G037923 [Oculina patagonica]